MSKNFHNYSIGVSPSELVVKQSLTRNFQKALDNDSVLRDKLVSIDKQINSYTKFNTYKRGDLVYFKTSDDSIKLYLLKSKIDNNTFEPTIENGIVKADDHWQIYDTDKEFAVDDIVELSASNYKAEFNKVHEKDTALSAHTYGKINDINDLKILDSTLLNIDQKRVKFLYPYNVRKLTNDNVIQHGYYRKWQNGVIEYDIIFKVGKIGTDSETGFDIIKANNLTILDRNYNNLYFSEKDNNGNFSEFNKIGDQNILVDNVYQQNLLKTMNVFYGEIIFPQPFKDLNYMIFNSNVKNVLNQIQQGEYKPLNGAIDYRLIVDGKNLIGHIDDIVDNTNSYYLTDIPINSDIINICDDALANLNSPKTDEAPGIEFVIDPNASVLENIGDRAFFNSNVSKIQIPRSVKHIGKEAFRECDRLTDITFDVEEGSPYPRMSRDIFIGCTSLTSININVYPKATNRLLRATANPLEYYSTLSGDLPLVDRLNKESNYWEAYGLTQDINEPIINKIESNTNFISFASSTFNSSDFIDIQTVDNNLKETDKTTINLSDIANYNKHVKQFTKINSYNKIKKIIDNNIFKYERDGNTADIIGIKDNIDKDLITYIELPQKVYDIINEDSYTVYDVKNVYNIFNGLNNVKQLNLVFNKKYNIILDSTFFNDSIKKSVEKITIKNANAIKRYTFRNFENLKELNIDISNSYIDRNVFYNCPQLQIININNYDDSIDFYVENDTSPLLFGASLNTTKYTGLYEESFNNLSNVVLNIDNKTIEKQILKSTLSNNLMSVLSLSTEVLDNTKDSWIVVSPYNTSTTEYKLATVGKSAPDDITYYKNDNVVYMGNDSFRSNNNTSEIWLCFNNLHTIDSNPFEENSLLERIIVTKEDCVHIKYRSLFKDIYLSYDTELSSGGYSNDIITKCGIPYVADYDLNKYSYLNTYQQEILSTNIINNRLSIINLTDSDIVFKDINNTRYILNNSGDYGEPSIVPYHNQYLFAIPSSITSYENLYNFQDTTNHIINGVKNITYNGTNLTLITAVIPKSIISIDANTFRNPSGNLSGTLNSDISSLIIDNYQNAFNINLTNIGLQDNTEIIWLYLSSQIDYKNNIKYNIAKSNNNDIANITLVENLTNDVNIYSSYDITSNYKSDTITASVSAILTNAIPNGNNINTINIYHNSLSIARDAFNYVNLSSTIIFHNNTINEVTQLSTTNWGLDKGFKISCSDGIITI